MKHITDTVTLNNGVQMPWFGFGTYKAQGNEVEKAVEVALQAGYRSIDTAAIYGNEEEVGRAIAASGINREELFVTTKLWNDDQGYDSTLRAFEESLKRLHLDFIDLYLIHWPGKDKYTETWRAFEKLYEEGRVRAIGVSNFHIHHLEELAKSSHIAPAVNQVELHPRFIQKELRDYCSLKSIQIEAWAPLMKGKLNDNETLISIGNKYGKTPSQVILRWNIQSGIVTIPKSVTPSRIIENANIFDFVLTEEELNQITSLNKNERIGRNPEEVLF
ncbi:aldo/keto reductase [Paenibacillus sediminis]|uniref:Diketogulonate reductase-like aldo/keto reductase n=1 Tax=Paenibacillus sediminis TaxID=664909 RepID=A0ABS4H6A9_9BACL|nr:aldo/keto reductase [Paenibacillus sediminis]MBP1937777.1 diketogulonate reductase-like aldo/keto reductase [Paenibacillus sediminis]